MVRVAGAWLHRALLCARPAPAEQALALRVLVDQAPAPANVHSTRTYITAIANIAQDSASRFRVAECAGILESLLRTPLMLDETLKSPLSRDKYFKAL